MKAIIPTGGRGMRMRPLTFSSNKHFIPIAGKPLIFYPIETVVDAGIREIGITYNPESFEQVRHFLGHGSKWGAQFTYILQEKPLGLADIIKVSEKYLNGEPFLFHLGDNIFTEGIKKAIDYFLTEKPNSLVTMVRHKENWRLGVPYFDQQGRLIAYVEKPKDPPHDFAIPGLYFFDTNVFKCFQGKDQIKPSERGELEISTLIQWLMDHKFRVEVIPYQGKWLDPGKFDDWLDANQYLLKTTLKPKIASKIGEEVVIKGRVKIGSDCRISHSQIYGPVIIGANVTITDSFIGPFTSVSDGCMIENSRIENSVLMDNVKIINVKQPVQTSLIGSASEIVGSNNSVSLLKLFIGEKCLLGV